MSEKTRRFVTSLLFLVGIGCEAEPEQFHFINETTARVEVIFSDPPQGPYDHGFAEPGSTFHYARRPVALHGESWCAATDDEEQFLHILRKGVIIVDGGGHRVQLDAPTLRKQATYKWPHTFIMHIRPDLFGPAR